MITTAGFLEPDPGLFQLDEPVFSVNGFEIADSEAIEGWDYSVDLGVSWEVEIDKVRLLDQCGLGPSTDIRLGFRWRSNKTKPLQLGAWGSGGPRRQPHTGIDTV